MSLLDCYCRTRKEINNKTTEYTFYSYNSMFKICCLVKYHRNVSSNTFGDCGIHCGMFDKLLNFRDFKTLIYNNEIIIVHSTAIIQQHTHSGYNNRRIIYKVQNINIEINENLNINNKITNLENKINVLTEELNKKDNLNKRLIDTLMLYRYKEFNNTITYDYNEIKQKNKALNSEFKRVAKLMKLC